MSSARVRALARLHRLRARRERARPRLPRPPRFRSGCRPRPRPSAPLLPTRRAGLLGVALVRLDDALHELVADDVLVAELDELDAVDAAEDIAHLNQPGRLLARQVDLRDIAR